MDSKQIYRSICKILDGEDMNDCINGLVYSLGHVAHDTIKKDLINQFFEKVKNDSLEVYYILDNDVNDIDDGDTDEKLN